MEGVEERGGREGGKRGEHKGIKEETRGKEREESGQDRRREVSWCTGNTVFHIHMYILHVRM